jgi:hypothetical protein
MIHSDYTKELGMNIAQPKVPLPYVLGLLTLILAVGGYGFHATWPAAHEAHGAKKSEKTAKAPVAAGAVAVADK